MKKIITILALALPFVLSSCLKDEVYGGATISDVKSTVAYTETTPVTVTAKVSSLVPVNEVNLFYQAGSAAEQKVAMTGSETYTGVIPAQPLGTEVSFHIEVRTESMTSKSPITKYVVGATPINYSGLILNELNGNDKFIELFNKGTEAIPLEGVYIAKDTDDNITWVCDNRSIAPGEYLLLYSEDVVIGGGAQEGYPEALVFHSGLSAKKAVRIHLFSPANETIDDFYLKNCLKTAPASYSRNSDGKWYFADATPGKANVEGTEAVEGLVDPDLPEPGPDDDTGGDTGDDTGDDSGDQPAVVAYKVFINEISCGEKKIEIYNAESIDVNIAGYVFTKDGTDTWTVPDGMGGIPAGGFVVYTAKQADASTGPTFGLSGTKGFTLSLAAGETVIDAIDNSSSSDTFTTLEDTETLGRKSDGASPWVVFSEGTIGSSNAAGTVKAGPAGIIILNELNGNDKFIELYNCGEAAIDLTGYKIFKDGTEVWTGSQSVAAGEYLLLYSEDVAVAGGAQEGYPEALVFHSGLSAKKAVKVEILDAEGVSADCFNYATYGGKAAPASYGRNADGDWYFQNATPGAANVDGTDKVTGLE